MKKAVAILLIVLGVLMAGAAVFADANDAPEWFEEMIQWRKGQIQESYEAGTITAEQAEAWNAHFEYMEEFHNEVGFPGPGGCGGRGRGFGGQGMWYQQ